jgi:probable HAF family extracellular repeat protein
MVPGENTMNRITRSAGSTLGKALVLCAFAGALLGDTSGASNRQESGGAEQQRRHQNELTFTQFDFPGASITAVSGINDPGQIVGAYIDAGGAQHGFLLDDGVFTTIDFPGSALSTEASDIDNHGQIVGAYVDAAGVSHGFLRERNGTFTTIDVPGATVTGTQRHQRSRPDGGRLRGRRRRGPGAVGGTEPTAINNHGQIVGVCFDGVRRRAFLLSNGTFTRITPPGEFIPYLVGTFATDIDERGRIAGASL